MSKFTKLKKISVLDIQQKKADNKKIVMITAFDYPSARQVDLAGAEITLVGDSLAMTVLGHPNTVSLTMDEMIHHCKAVARGTQQTLLVGDMPFMSYQASQEDAVRNAGRMLKEGGMEAVKLEGGKKIAKTIRAIVDAGILVMGHIGLTPQSATQLGGFKVQGKTAEVAQLLLEDALALQEAGCFSIVLEAIPSQLAEVITNKLDIPTIGIGAGISCDGQVLVYHDLLGLFDQFVPKFVKQYANLQPEIIDALQRYATDVRSGTFPSDSQSFNMNEAELKRFIGGLAS